MAGIGKIISRKIVPVLSLKPPVNPLVKQPVQVPDSKLIGIFAAVDDDSRKLIEYLGPEMVNQAAWYTAVYWDGFDANWSEGALRLSSDGANGFLTKGSFWEVNKNYRITFSVDRIAGTLFGPYDGIGSAGSLSATGSLTYDYTPDDGVNMYVYSSGFQGDLLSLSIKKILKREIDE